MQRPFTGVTLDRAELERRDPSAVQRLLDKGQAVVASRDGVVVVDGTLLRAAAKLNDGREPILLGLDGATGVFAIDLDDLPAAERSRLLDRGRMISLREAGAELGHAEAGLAAYLTALLNWHRRHRFCDNCGSPTNIAEAGFSRRCPSCGATHFPRTDPVVIMTVEHEGHLLLGRRAGWPAGRCSVLAGFIAPGESAEEAVMREVREESGIIVRDPVYVASQPWPFPSSLMLGFDAQSDGGQPGVGDGELAEVRWVPLRAVREAVAERNPELRLPPPISIARFLIERWVAQQPETD
jgi:NAD+ diphosphatase